MSHQQALQFIDSEIAIESPFNPEFSQSNDEIMFEFENSARTAISRKKTSAPLQQIIDQYPEYIRGSAINYAKGRSNIDSESIESIAGHVAEYDYTHCPTISVLQASYKFVYCGYCVNVLPPAPREEVWKTLAKLCDKDSGIVVVAARSDKDRGIKGEPQFDGVRTSINTYQLGYQPKQLESEALRHFAHVTELKPKGSGYRLVVCSHASIDEILN